LEPDLLSESVTEVVVEIDYQSTTPPFTQEEDGGPQGLYSAFGVNLFTLFSGREREFRVPKTLDEMTALDVTPTTYTSQDLFELSMETRDEWDTRAKRTFHVLVLDGQLTVDGEVQPTILGAALVEPRIIAVFRPSIEALEMEDDLEFFYARIEQYTLVHELGHVMGLVDNGIPAITDHQDAATGHHCTETSCIMHHSAAGLNRAREFAMRVGDINSLVLFDTACLDDVEAFDR